jgi:hypothetical protein
MSATKRKRSDNKMEQESDLAVAPASDPVSSTTIRCDLETYFDSKTTLRTNHNGNDYSMYIIGDVYGGSTELPRWFYDLRVDRFEGYNVDGLLYRPQIVNEICQNIESNLNSSVGKGLFVKGPQNIGKSFSLVNTVIHLESTGDYLVTFIPDCENWLNPYHLVEAIFFSFGSDAERFGYCENNVNNQAIVKIVDEIDSILKNWEGGGKKWIFVFDQINKIFKKPSCSMSTGMVGDLPFPFNMMKRVMKSGRITSIISASANNEAANIDRHMGFVEFNHTTKMERKELEIAFFNSRDITKFEDKTLIDTAMELTDGVPGYVHIFLNTCNGNGRLFEDKIENEVDTSFNILSESSSPMKLDAIKKSIITSILGMKTNNRRYYDRQFFIQDALGGGLFRYHALIPAIVNAYTAQLFQDLLLYVSEKEAELLQICSYTETEQFVKGSLFEFIVISRILTKKISFTLPKRKKRNFTVVSKPAIFFETDEFPTPAALNEDGVYIPRSRRFPAIDIILRQGKTVIGVQIHVGKKGKVDIEKFSILSKSAGWLTSFDAYLLYLSPTTSTAAKMNTIIGKNPSVEFSMLALDIKSIKGLDDLLWPTRT